MKTGLLIDLDGVVYVGERPIPGSRAAIEWIQKSGIPHLFVTNTTSRPLAILIDKLHKMGIEVSRDEVLTPVIAANHWLLGHGIRDAALFVGASTRSDFDPAVSAAVNDRDRAGAVVIGDLGEAWNFDTLNHAFRLLMDNEKAPLIALGMTRYWRAEDGLRLDVAPFVVALEHASGRKAVVLGKPSVDFFQQACDACHCEPGGLVMVGDDIRGDVGGAQQAGMTGVLVRTGKFSEKDLLGAIHPDAVLDSLSDIPAWWHSA